MKEVIMTEEQVRVFKKELKEIIYKNLNGTVSRAYELVELMQDVNHEFLNDIHEAMDDGEVV